MDHLFSIVEKIEEKLCGIYNLDSRVSAAEHLITTGDSKETSIEIMEQEGIPASRTATLFSTVDDELSISIFISSEIAETLRTNCPTKQLNNGNIDAFCAISEEVSHFHYIVHRFTSDAVFSLLELECQGEIDRFISSALFLKEQSGYAHHPQLLQLFFTDPQFCSRDNEGRYKEASYFAKKFLDRIAMPAHVLNPITEPDTITFLNETYRASWRDKLAKISGA